MQRKKILHKAHTGKLVHHRHTSYAGLALVFLLVFAPLVVASKQTAVAAEQALQSQGVYAIVAAPVPNSAPVITSPAIGTMYVSNEPVVVAGSCPEGSFVKVSKNNVFAGAVLCSGGQFRTEIDLFMGVNTLIVTPYNVNNVAGPDSAAVAVRQQATDSGPITSLPVDNQFFITSDVQYLGVKLNEPISWPITINGGQAPYAINVGWGDGKSNLISRSDDGTFTVDHIYRDNGQAGAINYDITLTASDANGESSFIHLVAISGGQDAGLAASVKKGYDISGYIKAAWQIAGVSVLVVASFWLGEQRELLILRRRMKAI